MSNARLREAIALARAGRREEARDLFISLVNLDEENELAWLWLVDLVDDLEDQIIALENALTINPDNEKARARLQQLQAARQERTPKEEPVPATTHDLDEVLTAPGQDLAAVARRYEETGELEKAIIVYEQMMAMAEKGSTRRRARQRRTLIERQLALQQPVPVHTTFTLLRLSLGPFFLYLLLILIQGAYRPWRVPFPFYLGSIAVLVGSLLVVGSHITSRHAGWERLLGDSGLPSGGLRLLLASSGLVLIVLPYVGFLVSAFRRMLATPGIPLPGGG